VYAVLGIEQVQAEVLEAVAAVFPIFVEEVVVDVDVHGYTTHVVGEFDEVAHAGTITTKAVERVVLDGDVEQGIQVGCSLTAYVQELVAVEAVDGVVAQRDVVEFVGAAVTPLHEGLTMGA